MDVKLRTTQQTIFLPDLIDKIYDAALDPAEWDGLIQLMQDYFSSHMAGLFMQDTQQDKLLGAYFHGISDEHLATYDQYYVSVNPWFIERDWMQPGRVLTDHSIDDRHDDSKRYINTEFYNDWSKQQDFRHAMGGMLQAENNISINFTLFRSASSGHYTPNEIQDYTLLSKHLVKAVTINQKLQQQSILEDFSSSWFDKLHFGIILLDNHGKLIHSNHYANSLFNENDGLTMKNSQLHTEKHEQDLLLQNIIQTCLSKQNKLTTAAQNNMAVSRPSNKLPYSLIALPIQQKQNQFPPFNLGITKPAVTIFITDPQRSLDIKQDYLINRYSFSPPESRLVNCLVQGQHLKEAAASCGIKYETARWYLKSIFEKSQTQSQSDLIRSVLTDISSHISI